MSNIILTMRQQQIYQWMWRYWKESGFAPSQQEVADAHEITLSTAQKHIKALDAKGRIRSVPGKFRGITFLD